MKPFTAAAAFLAMVAAIGCRAKPPPVQDAPAATVSVADASSSTTPTPSGPPSVVASARPAPEGDVLVGKVTTTKGATPVVAGRLLSPKAFRERFGTEWRDRVMGARVRLIGRLHVHVCGPEEQCLTSGEIHSLQDISAIEICSGSKTVADVDPVDCPKEDSARPSTKSVTPPGLVPP